ncbi:Uncharacterised protein [Pandoraea pulmonicola]|uniref:Uncharacterized protein n=1 Tax=Pandoraea pulmonicola TaxID=93221 RepID=A0AAJ4Z8Y8_PANPU|nr:Uncharacterised protein [Pandoraea pulmonicola]
MCHRVMRSVANKRAASPRGESPPCVHYSAAADFMRADERAAGWRRLTAIDVGSSAAAYGGFSGQIRGDVCRLLAPSWAHRRHAKHASASRDDARAPSNGGFGLHLPVSPPLSSSGPGHALHGQRGASWPKTPLSRRSDDGASGMLRRAQNASVLSGTGERVRDERRMPILQTHRAGGWRTWRARRAGRAWTTVSPWE